MNTLNLESSMKWKDKIIDYLILHGGAIVSGIVIFIVGLFLAQWVAKMTLRALEKRDLEPPVKLLIARIVKVLVAGFTTVIALGTCGVNVMALVAGIGVVGVGVGLAMQGVLQNLFAGLMIILTKPFRIGEYIELLSVHGQVAQIELFSTTLIHPDRSRVVIPNRKIIGEILHNYGGIRQLDLSVGVAYATDLGVALAAVHEVLAASPRTLKDPAPVVGVSMLSDSSIVIAVKPWAKMADFVSAQAELNRAIVEKFRASQIEIPFPQRQIRVLNESPNLLNPLSLR